jgi:hypothetical protein
MSNPYRGPSIDTSYQIKIISSETAWPNEPKLGRYDICVILNKYC